MMRGQHALVTGGSRGIGKAICLELAEQGVNVAVNFSGNREKAEAVAEQCRQLGVEALAVQADVGNADSVKQMIDTVMEAFGSIDILVNNAGITRDTLIMRMKEEDFDAVINTNLKGVFNCSKAVTRPMMKQRYGRIINISSVVGVLGNAGQANYVASKAGVIGLTKSLARELANRNIRVNAVAPGFIGTEMTDELTEETKKALLEQIPLAELGKPEDVARVVAFLASGASAYMTGQTLHVDGGMVMP
ncbi:3-oxoacyl-[acyl-carrier-protein] reductase [Salipaludibacillus agaradhaerens]|uniref:3-oxoacyl-[acyl-carrier-protein] reductase n=1 Tax=Salipaludibacillus agaradhaerens TaxID=76935 RepID=A0A9Q4FYR3_SALAG|nr:3-oxoacyl-[acyl-carrier-protein] reductase [Salipaludibacillus agaradhaerens]MCR6096004.1 3-oxoacyl-[acyl-carrier-protein] reductase [Salipaludibacillus agaradhaerens]MCR6114437.1 3-oxoacyl-[acyl-carrier-protein] reductase [Salipaludibacillus agaradhaerens]